ncbi:hypothetical protein [Streptomyces sp. NPDC048269]|uniref:hypothetical protein n=1 Tax=Streptomyces sp. NPDC048269 TaxID=3155753 RepID=UPI00343B7996
MTLLSDQADDIRALVGSADPGAVWAVGGAEGVEAVSHSGVPEAVSHSGVPEAAEDPRVPEAEDPGDPGAADLDVGALAAALALWPAIGSLVEEGALRLHTPLAAYGDEAAAGTPAGTTAHHLLTHADGEAALTLTRLAEHLCGMPLAEFATTRVWHPLGMTRTRFADDTLRAPLADLVRFLRHLLSPVEAVGAVGAVAQGSPGSTGSPGGPVGITRAWTAESLRIRTGELTPARGLLWHPAPHGVWTHPAPAPGGPALWISPRHRRWALLLPTTRDTPLRTAFRAAAFALP